MKTKKDPTTGKFTGRKKIAPAKKQPFNSRSWDEPLPEWEPAPEWDPMEGNVWSDPAND
jgi:hypothetical protein